MCLYRFTQSKAKAKAKAKATDKSRTKNYAQLILLNITFGYADGIKYTAYCIIKCWWCY